MKAQIFSIGKHFNTSWDPLFTIKKTGENISEHRFSLYIDLHKNYQVKKGRSKIYQFIK